MLGEHYHEEPAAVGSPEQHEALFVCRMAGIVDNVAKRITECRDRLLERDLVLDEIERRLVWVPLERQRPRQLSTSLQEIDRCPSDRGRLGFRRLGVNVASRRRQPLPRTQPEIIAKFDDHSEATAHTPIRGDRSSLTHPDAVLPLAQITTSRDRQGHGRGRCAVTSPVINWGHRILRFTRAEEAST